MRQERELAVRGERVVRPDGIGAATIWVRDGRIARLARYEDAPAGVPVYEAGELVVLPGLVDTHVHINEPGRTEWEGFESATRAAAAGGITTLVDMPLNSVPPTTSVAGLEAKRAAAADRCHVDVGFWGGVVPGNAGELEGLAAAGVLGFKCFLSPSGVDEFSHVGEPDLRVALPILARLGLPLLVHAESPARLIPPAPAADPRTYATWLGSRPSAAEEEAIALLIRLAAEFDARVHIVHLATADALPLLRGARARGVGVTVETCPHYLSFAAEEIPDGATAFKCAPPIREARHREGLWAALAAGEIDLVATDHSPAPASLKRTEEGNFVEAWGGIASLQLALPSVWTGAAARGHDPAALARWMSAGPAALAGLSGTKGSIAPGADADLVVWDPVATAAVEPSTLEHRHKLTPFAGRLLRGAVRATFVRGRLVFADGRVVPDARGRCLPLAGARAL